MGEKVRGGRIARGKRVVEVKPVKVGRDPGTVASLTIALGSGGTATALLTEAERVAVIEALGGRDGYDADLADRLANGAYDRD
jgi:hypothetical protein